MQSIWDATRGCINMLPEAISELMLVVDVFVLVVAIKVSQQK